MWNRTYICIDCKTARRAETSTAKPRPLRCRLCGGPLCELSHRWRIPRKTDEKAWLLLQAQARELLPRQTARFHTKGMEALDKVDVRIGLVSKREPSAEREKLLERLEKERQQIAKDYFPGQSIPRKLPTPAPAPTESRRTKKKE